MKNAGLFGDDELTIGKAFSSNEYFDEMGMSVVFLMAQVGYMT